MEFLCIKDIKSSHLEQTTDFSSDVTYQCIGVRPMGLRGASAPPPPPILFLLLLQRAIFWQKKSGNTCIRAKPLDFRACNGEKYSGKRLQHPPPPLERYSSRTLMCQWTVGALAGALDGQYIFSELLSVHVSRHGRSFVY